MRAHVVLAAKLALAALLVAWLLRSGRLDLAELATLDERWAWFALANLPYGLAQLAAAARWRLLLEAQGARYAFRDVFDLTLIGLFFNQMIFGSTGGDVVRAWAVAADHPDRRSAAVMSVLVDRVLGLVVMLVLTLAAGLWRFDLVAGRADLALLLGVIAAASTAAGLLLWAFGSRRIRGLPAWRAILARLPARGLVERLVEALAVYRRHPREMALATLYSALLHAGIVATNLCLARALVGHAYDWSAVLFLVPLAHLAMTIPINPPGAIGTAEAIYAYLFGLIGVTQGGLICVLQRLVFYVWALPGGLLWALRRGRPAAAAAARR